MVDEPIVFILDDEEEVARSLRWLIESVGYRTQLYYRSNDFLMAYQAHQRGCLVVDIRMPHISGLELQIILNKNNINLPIIFITGHGDIAMAVRAMKAGAVDFLTKPLNNQVLLESINKAIQLDAKTHSELKLSHEVTQREERLTPREREVMELMLMGKLTKAIAYQLNISTHTAEIHRSRVLRKMNVKSLAELISLVIKNRPASATTHS